MKVDLPAAGIKAGSAFEAVVAVKIDEGWHVYATDEMPDGPRPLLIALADTSPFRAGGPLKAPQPGRDTDGSFGQVTASFTINAMFRLPVVALPDVAAGPHDLVADVVFQACDGCICLPARTTALKTTVAVIK